MAEQNRYFRDFPAGVGPSGGKMRKGRELVWTFLISWKCILRITKQISNIFLLALETKESKGLVVYSSEVLQKERNQFMLMSNDSSSASCCRGIFHFSKLLIFSKHSELWMFSYFCRTSTACREEMVNLLLREKTGELLSAKLLKIQLSFIVFN